MNFLKISDSINGLLYQRSVHKLTSHDLRRADRWTHQFIKENHPEWTDTQIQSYIQEFMKIKLIALDEWSQRFLND